VRIIVSNNCNMHRLIHRYHTSFNWRCAHRSTSSKEMVMESMEKYKQFTVPRHDTSNTSSDQQQHYSHEHNWSPQQQYRSKNWTIVIILKLTCCLGFLDVSYWFLITPINFWTFFFILCRTILTHLYFTIDKHTGQALCDVPSARKRLGYLRIT